MSKHYASTGSAVPAYQHGVAMPRGYRQSLVFPRSPSRFAAAGHAHKLGRGQ